MEVRAIAKSVRVSPRKVRLIADAVRNMAIDDALVALEATPKQASLPVAKVLKSAVANATHNAKLERANLIIASIQVNEAQAFKRFRPSTRGRIHPYKKRGSNITVIVKDKMMALPVVKEKQIVKKEETKKEEKKQRGGKK
jgi:large subunit ribosomal protein L22